MRSAQGRSPHEATAWSLAGHGVDSRRLERLVVEQWRHDRREPARQHRLAGAGRPGEQNVVCARRRDFESATRPRQAAYLGEVERLVERGIVVALRGRRWRIGPGGFALQALAKLAQATRDANGDAAHQGRLCGVDFGHDDRRDAGANHCIDQRERAGHMADRAVETELADHADVVECASGQLLAGDQQPDARRRARDPHRSCARHRVRGSP